jgi:hypothetical protein
VSASNGWDWHKDTVLETFVLSNYAFLILDVYLAHSVNRFRHEGEWIPVGFSIVAVLVLAPALILRLRERGRPFVRQAGLIVGYASIAVGLAGVVYHLDSQFFSQWTLQSLVYTAPFAAPVAFAGLGFLLLVNRTVPCGDAAWSQWVLFFAVGGFVGNFVLSLCDHAMNGFFHVTEWLPVFSSALAVGFLGVAVVERHRSFLWIVVAVLALQVAIGLVGVYFHLIADINGLSSSLFENFVHGAPVFAPLLFVDLVLLAMIGLWDTLSGDVHQRGAEAVTSAASRRARRRYN